MALLTKSEMSLMFAADDLPLKPCDYLCPVCKKELVKTPSGFFACLDPDHTRLLGERLARASAARRIAAECFPGVLDWQEKQNIQSPEFDDELGLPILSQTTIRGLYVIAGDSRLFRVTRRDDLAAAKAVRFSPKRNKKKVCLVRQLRAVEFMRYLRRGLFVSDAN